MSRRPIDRVNDILACIAAIRLAQRQLLDAEAAGDDDPARTAFDAIMYNLVVIGEAVKALPREIRNRNLDTPWSDIAGMRDVLTHHYFRVSGDVVRATIDAPLTDLESVCIIEARRLELDADDD